MTQSNRIGPMALAIFAGIIGLTLAATSLAHNIEGVLPRISAVPGTFEYYIQMVMEGGATAGLNMVALFGFTFSTLMFVDRSFGKSAGLTIVALLAMLWSGATQLGVIADKTFSVSGSKTTAIAQYKRAIAAESEIISAMPTHHKFMGEAQQDVITALAALKSHRYSNKTAWQTTNNCTGDITATKSISLCNTYNRAVRALETSKYAAGLEKRRVAVNAIIAKGEPQTIDAGPELIAAATMGVLTVKNVQVILVFLRSFGIDLAAGLFLAASFSIWPARPSKPAPAPNDNGGDAVHPETPVQNDGPNTRVQTRAKSQRIIEQFKSGVQSVQNTEHREQLVLQAIHDLSENGELKTTYRVLASKSDTSIGSINEILNSLESHGLIDRTLNNRRHGQHIRVLNTEHAYA